MESNVLSSAGGAIDEDFSEYLSIVDKSETPDEIEKPFSSYAPGGTRHIRKIVLCECGGEFDKMEFERVCRECGIIETVEVDDGVSMISMGSYNTSNDSANPIRITGPGGTMLQKRLMCTTSNSDKTKHKTTIKTMINITQRYAECKIPIDVVKEAADKYYKVQQVGINRGDVHKGSMATCLMRTCNKANIHQKREVFASMFKINLSDISAGEKLIDNYVADGKLDSSEYQIIDSEKTIIPQILTQYFMLLGVPMPSRYYSFVERLIRFSIKFRIADNSVASSKCAGAIYVIALRCPELNITTEKIIRECQTSKSTFRRFSDAINNILNAGDSSRLRNKLKHLFKTHEISLSY